MSIFKTYTFTWPSISIFKISLLALGIAIGTYWNDFFAPYIGLLLVIALTCGFYVAYIVFKK